MVQLFRVSFLVSLLSLIQTYPIQRLPDCLSTVCPFTKVGLSIIQGMSTGKSMLKL